MTHVSKKGLPHAKARRPNGPSFSSLPSLGGGVGDRGLMHAKARRREGSVVIDDTGATLLEGRRAEVHEQSQWLFRKPEVGQQLLSVDRRQPLDRLQFDNEAVFNKQIGAETLIESDAVIDKGNRRSAPPPQCRACSSGPFYFSSRLRAFPPSRETCLSYPPIRTTPTHIPSGAGRWLTMIAPWPVRARRAARAATTSASVSRSSPSVGSSRSSQGAGRR